MSQYISRSSFVAAWCFTLVAALWIVSARVSVVATLAMAIVGMAPAMVLFVLARRPEQTLAENLRAINAGGSE